MKIAIIGTGISGLVAAYHISRANEVTLFEANNYVGGHTNTIRVKEGPRDFPVDTGFIVYNEENYPNFIRLMNELGVETQPSDMSFSVTCEESGLQYSGTSINSLFAQRRNLLRPGFLRMVLDIIRFYRQAPRQLESAGYDVTLSEFLRKHRYSKHFINNHILPMGAAIWSSGTESMEDFPARYFVDFFENHGFLKLVNRPKWRVIRNGSQQYIRRLISKFEDQIRLCCPVKSITRSSDSVQVRHEHGSDRFDYVVIATHSDQALQMLSDPSPLEFEILGDIRYERNETVLHTDSTLIPKNPLVRSSWNYSLQKKQPDRPIVTYYMNRLQSLETKLDYCVTLNRTDRIDPAKVLKKITYEHPVFDSKAIAAQKRISEINGKKRTFFCGAYWGYGFHEDGVVSGLRAFDAFSRVIGEKDE